MNKYAIFGLIFSGFALGVGAGVYASASCFRKKYEEESLREIEKEKEELKKKYNKKITPVAKAREAKKPEEKIPEVKNVYASLTRDYMSVVTEDVPFDEDEENVLYISDLTDPVTTNEKEEPYEIDPYEYGNKEGYDMVSYSCFSDGVITNEYDEALSEDEVEASIGSSVRRKIVGNKEPAVYIRNDKTKIDYEIMADSQPYSDFLLEKKYKANGENIMNAVTQIVKEE